MGKEETAKLVTKLSLQGATETERALVKLGGAVGHCKDAFNKFQQAFYFAKQNFDWVAGIEKSLKNAFMQPIVAADNWREALQMVGLTADGAKQKIQDLLQESLKLDQPHASTVEAYITAKKMGGDDLASPDNLALISRSAKYANQDFAQMSQTFGSFYNKLKEGKEFGMAAKAFREMGLISGETMTQIDAFANSDSLETLKKKIEDLSEEYDKLQPSQRYGVASQLNQLTAQYEQQKTNPETVDAFAKIWKKTMDEIAAKVSNVDLADQTYSDVMQHNADMKANTLAQIGGPAFKEDFARKQREMQAQADMIKYGQMEEWVKNTQATSLVKNTMKGIFSPLGEFMDDPMDKFVRGRMPHAMVNEVNWGALTRPTDTERLLGRLAGMPSNLSLFPVPGARSRLDAVDQSAGPTIDGMFGLRMGEVNENLGIMIDRSQKLRDTLNDLLGDVIKRQGEF